MFRYLILIFLFFSFASIYGQTDAIPSDSLLAKAQKLHHETVLLRVDLGSLFRWRNGAGWGGIARIGLEGKVSDHWSLLGEVGTGFAVVPTDRLFPQISRGPRGLTLVVAPRLYRRSIERDNPPETASGFSSTYWTIKVSSEILRGNPGASSQYAYYSDNISIAPMVGVQQRLWNMGFIDAAFGIRINYLNPGSISLGRWPLSPGWNLLPTAQVQFGLGLGQ